MLDVLKLEALVDEALKNETSNSLIEWLKIQRDGDIYSYLGDGKVKQCNTSSSSFSFGITKPIKASFVDNQSFDSYKNRLSNFTFAA